MRAVLVALALLAVLWIWIPSGSPTPGPAAELTIYSTDSGRETAIKFMRSYARLTASAMDSITSKQAAGSYANSLAMTEDWAAQMEAARKAATQGVNARVVVLVKDATPEQLISWLKDYQTGLKEIGR